MKNLVVIGLIFISCANAMPQDYPYFLDMEKQAVFLEKKITVTDKTQTVLRGGGSVGAARWSGYGGYFLYYTTPIVTEYYHTFEIRQGSKIINDEIEFLRIVGLIAIANEIIQEAESQYKAQMDIYERKLAEYNAAQLRKTQAANSQKQAQIRKKKSAKKVLGALSITSFTVAITTGLLAINSPDPNLGNISAISFGVALGTGIPYLVLNSQVKKSTMQLVYVPPSPSKPVLKVYQKYSNDQLKEFAEAFNRSIFEKIKMGEI